MLFLVFGVFLFCFCLFLLGFLLGFVWLLFGFCFIVVVVVFVLRFFSRCHAADKHALYVLGRGEIDSVSQPLCRFIQRFS